MKRIKPNEGNKTFCMAPWLHTYLSPQLERRLCCASLEKSTNFKQYIDSSGPDKHPLKFTTLEEHWNSDYMKQVRIDLMEGKEIPQCETCNHKLLNAQVYRQHFNRMFENQIDEAFEKTDEAGHTTMEVTSFDYRFSNLCNFTCRMCGPPLSSSWETEEKKHGVFDYKEQPWGDKEIQKEINKFHDQQIIKEFQEAIESKKIKEFYWCGGEPLMWKIHWTSMQRVVELGYADQVYARYNSNMSRINFYGKNLFDDCLKYFRDWQICASIDATGEIGEYIRTGLNYNKWLENIKYGKKFMKNPRQLELDLTVTMPGLFDLENMYKLSKDLKLVLLCKKVFSFGPNNLWSPLCLPRDILHEMVDNVIEKTSEKKNVFNLAFYEGLQDLKSHKTHEERWPDKYKEGLKRGKQRIEYLDKIRGTDIKKILSKNKKVLEWWNDI
tara:strand:- start:527 stop:1843 length:1317 start_codon:yes stop_codon:yes gene_type:complete